MKRNLFGIALFASLLIGCRPITTNEDIPVVIEGDVSETEIPTEVDEIAPSSSVYRATETVLTDLINTKLEVSFDWNTSQLIGKETLTAKPHFYATDSLVLDAKGMEIKNVTMNGSKRTFTYEEDVLVIRLDKKYTRAENYTVVIDYISKPDERTTGGSAAITSDKGLYFINPKGEDKDKMPQIWTQGETESSSVWFPTIDAPNSKTKQEIYITVADKYLTVSNGKLVSSKKNADGTRTDYWKQELPHAPYLFMMAVGEFKEVKDFYKRQDGTMMPVNYYVEPEWEQYGKAIFGETPAMIDFFSKLLGVEYVWDKYHQIVVRDYVSGAMENTGAVIFGDYAYKTDRELLDGNDQSTIAHELFHHWFGDLVTCESWSNLSLNESFANYSQYLWDEHRFGLDEADYQAIGEADGYFASAQQAGYHDLIYFDYEDKEDMFDGHSYNKGGRILHMLRNYIGDEAFFQGLQNYLKTNSFKAAEFNQLRLAFEEVCGQDLNWFFNQWYLGKGHPTLEVNYQLNETDKLVTVNVDQKQEKEFGLFQLPVDVTVYDDRGATTTRIVYTEATTITDLSYVGPLKNVIFDSQAMLLAKITETKDQSWYIHQFYNGKRYASRKAALQFGLKSKTAESDKMILDALTDRFWEIRSTAIDKTSKLSAESKAKALPIIRQMAISDSMSAVRVSALNNLANNLPANEAIPVLQERMQKDRSFAVVSAGLNQLSKIDPAKAMSIAKGMENEKSSKMISGIASLYAKNGTADQLSFFQTALNGTVLQGFDKIGVLNSFTFYLSKQDVSSHRKAFPIFEKAAVNGGIYSKLFIPQYMEYLTGSLNSAIEVFRADEDKAKSSGNTNAADMARSKRIEAEALILDYAKLTKSVEETEE